MKKIVLILIINVALVNAQDVMSVEDAIRSGLQNNFTIQIARNDVEIAQNNAGFATAAFLPTVDASGGYQYSQSDQETNSPFSFGDSETRGYEAKILLNWTLFDGFRMFIDRSRYHSLTGLSTAQARNTIETTVVNILRAYFGLVQQQLLLDVAENTLEISETRLNKERVRREVGGASSTDFLNAQVSYNNDKALVITQGLRVAVALKELNILLGQKPDQPAQRGKGNSDFSFGRRI